MQERHFLTNILEGNGGWMSQVEFSLHFMCMTTQELVANLQ